MSLQSLFSLLLLTVLLLISTLSWPSMADEKCHPDDKQALLKIKETLNTNESTSFISWNNNTDCCADWDSVTCDKFTNRVVSLQLIRDPNLRGQIPTAIGDLSHLEFLSLYNLPNVSGPIPSTIANLNRLSVLHISLLNLSGPIPNFLSQLNNLTYLDLSFNYLTGPIPCSLSLIPNLFILVLDYNNLRGTIPSSLSNLRANRLILSLANNHLSGRIPASFKYIDFSSIDVSRNALRGDVSMLFGPNKTTKLMDLSWNRFEFNMSDLKVNLNLTSLDLSHNRVYGSIPKEMVDLQLMKLDVSYNRLCGQIPVGGTLQKFHYSSYFHNKCLFGAPLN